MAYTIRILGGLTIDVDGQTEPIHVPAATQRRALIFLTIHAGEVVSVDQLADAVWGGDAPKQLEHAVHSLVYRLRRHLADTVPGSVELGAIVQRADPGYRLVVDALTIDACRFTELVRRARPVLLDDPATARDLLTEALGLWHGDALVDVAYDDWAASEIRRLTEIRLCACEFLAEANIVLGDPELALAELESLTERFPLRESLWALLWRAMAATGRHLEIVASHQRAIERLSGQFQMPPSAHLDDLARRYALADTP